MKTTTRSTWLCAMLVMLLIGASTAQAQVRITEVSAWGSGNAPYANDWFELTNTGTSTFSLTAWTMDDNSNGSGKVALDGISSIAAGESVIFIENAVGSFVNTWFGGNAPAGLKIGTYTGSGVGLSTTADAVNVFNAAGVLQANVVFGASDGTSPYQTFNNAIGLNNTTISQLSVVGINGAFVAVNDSGEIGSPGVVVSAVPEPEGCVLALAGLGLVGLVNRKRKPA